MLILAPPKTIFHLAALWTGYQPSIRTKAPCDTGIPPMRKKFFFPFVILLLATATAEGQRAEEYLPLARDGAWCWFSDPRALYHNGKAERLYAGWASSKGDIMVGSYDYRTGEIRSTIVWPELQRDDHINPSLLILPDGRVMVFFTKHNGGLYYSTSLRSEDITEFEKVRMIDMGEMLCYTNPAMLSAEKNRIYLFFRGGYDWKPSFVYSDDLGKTWSDPKVMVAKPNAPKSNRPYMKVASDGKSKIHFAFTDGHPLNEARNSIYYLCYQQGGFFDATGKKLGAIGSLPINQDKVPKIYDGEKSGIRAWVWDVAADKDGKPAVVYSTLPEESHHEYGFATWNGTSWIANSICTAGSWFPRYDKKKEEPEPEPFYSGGIILDHANPNVVFLSRPRNDIFEIERWKTSDHGVSWSHQTVTDQSDHDNVRPVVVRDCPAEKSPRVLWMSNSRYRHYTDYSTGILADTPAPPFSADLRKADVTRVLASAAKWQIDNFDKVKHHQLDWTNGALYAGMVAWARISEDQRYITWLDNIGRKYDWQPSFRMYHADDICVSQMYLDRYRMTMDKRMLLPTKARIDWVIDNPPSGTLLLDYGDPSTLDRWSWCDALFMAPPVYARLATITGEAKYLRFMEREFRSTYELLYDREEHLFYRDHRYFAQREANGKKVFWGRGNGWVLAGLVSLLKELPPESDFRDFYVGLFKEMAGKVASVQGKDGSWHASLLDPDSYPNPETSSTGFFCYALAYGINAGLLNREEYLPHVKNSWSALVRAVYPDGKLGWVQPIGADPKTVTRLMTEVYGVGAFLLAGSEVNKMAE